MYLFPRLFKATVNICKIKKCGKNWVKNDLKILHLAYVKIKQLFCNNLYIINFLYEYFHFFQMYHTTLFQSMIPYELLTEVN